MFSIRADKSRQSSWVWLEKLFQVVIRLCQHNRFWQTQVKGQRKAISGSSVSFQLSKLILARWGTKQRNTKWSCCIMSQKLRASISHFPTAMENMGSHVVTVWWWSPAARLWSLIVLLPLKLPWPRMASCQSMKVKYPAWSPGRRIRHRESWMKWVKNKYPLRAENNPYSWE